jgi:hypothetical protein
VPAIIDTGHYRVRLILRPWSPSGGRVHTMAGSGSPGQTIGDGASAKLLRPLALYVDDRFAVWVLDHHRIVTIQGWCSSTIHSVSCSDYQLFINM